LSSRKPLQHSSEFDFRTAAATGLPPAAHSSEFDFRTAASNRAVTGSALPLAFCMAHAPVARRSSLVAHSPSLLAREPPQ
jgi:hypothetical protein